MTPSEKKAVLEFAKRSLEAAVSGGTPPGVPDSGVLSGGGGAFVTLKTKGRLRGCIGHFQGLGSLGETIRAMAAEAALGDPRFMPVSPEELPGIRVEVSVLSPMKPIEPRDVIPGTHGLYVRMGFRSGTLLPQVASEEGWDRETFLAHTCLKASLPPDAWLDPATELLAYTAEVIREESNP